MIRRLICKLFGHSLVPPICQLGDRKWGTCSCCRHYVVVKA